jgi:hypothetical protein
VSGRPDVVEQVPALVAEAAVDVDRRLEEVPAGLDPGQGRFPPVTLARPLRRQLIQDRARVAWASA